MPVVIENSETGETREIEKGSDGKYPKLKLPWRVKGTPELIRRKLNFENQVQNLNSRVAVLAARMGLPIADFLDTARWLLDKDCPYCQVATKVLRRIDEIGADRAIDILNRIQAAKAANDNATLTAIKAELMNVI